jgi:DtxR family Mn-dependent transcriptional regulator
MSTISQEDYLKAVYVFKETKEDAVTTTELARKLEVSNAAISDMSKKLDGLGLINYSRYKGMELTPDGEKTALKVIRRHRLWELFLVEALGLSWTEVHDEAELLEHKTSDFLIDKIDEYLNFPGFDPHGYPIPDKNGNMPVEPESIPLSVCETGKYYRIAKVNDDIRELIHFFEKIGLTLKKKIKVVERLAFDNSITILVDSVNHTISEKIAENIFLTKEGDK